MLWQKEKVKPSGTIIKSDGKSMYKKTESEKLLLVLFLGGAGKQMPKGKQKNGWRITPQQKMPG